MSYTQKDLQDVLDKSNEYAYSETGGLYLPASVTKSWQVLNPIHPDEKTRRTLHRLNTLGSFYYLCTVVLKKNKFQQNPNPDLNLHFQMCRVVEKDGLKEVIEIPRDHFKSTVYSECYPM
jgi:hypothetical protein